MHFRASSPYDYYRPSKCIRRVALRHRGVKESPRTEFDDLLARLGAERAAGEDPLELAARVYRGLRPDEIDEIERIALDRSQFFSNTRP